MEIGEIEMTEDDVKIYELISSEDLDNRLMGFALMQGLYKDDYESKEKWFVERLYEIKYNIDDGKVDYNIYIFKDFVREFYYMQSREASINNGNELSYNEMIIELTKQLKK